jgi:chromate transporter
MFCADQKVMNVLVLYLVLLKATVTAFAGLASLAVVRDELVVQRAVLTDAQLNEAVVISQATPGPAGLYVVSVGYFVRGLPGAIAGWLAMATPALLIVPLVHFAGRKAEHPRAHAVLESVVLSSAGLLLAAAIPLAKAAIVDPVTVLIALSTIGLLIKTKIDTLWIILGAAVTALAVSTARLLIP